MKFLVKTIFPLISAVYLSLLIGGQADATRKQYLILSILFFLIIKYFLSYFFHDNVVSKRKSLQTWVIGIISAAVLLAATDTFLVPKFEANRRASFSITALGQRNDSSHSSEIWILGIKNGGVPYDLNKISRDSAWEFKDGKILSSQHQPSTLRITFDQADKPVLTLLKHPWSGKARIIEDRKS